MNKFRLIILFLIFIILYILYQIVIYDSYEIVKHSDLPQGLLLTYNDEYNLKLVKRLEELSIEVKYYEDNEHVNSISKNGIKKEYDDPPFIKFIDEKLLLFVNGPNTIDSGIRFFILPKYSNLYLLSLEDLSTVKHYRVKSYVKNATLLNNCIYFRFKGDTFGRIKFK